MLVGELDYENMFEREELTHFSGNITLHDNKKTGSLNGSLHEEFEQTYFPFTSHVLMTLFMFFMAIIVMNLLFGLAVTDVQVQDSKIYRYNNT